MDYIKYEAMDAIAHTRRFQVMLTLMLGEAKAGELNEIENTLRELLEKCSLRIQNRLWCTLGQLSIARGQSESEAKLRLNRRLIFNKLAGTWEAALKGERFLGESTETVWDLYGRER